ncbi:hypothetical protein F183_A44190 [Bryobacterales bacterium F-183]|nr:hypothetical protein F183_A44190 [Bryobacterales bacterium F-183]
MFPIVVFAENPAVAAIRATLDRQVADWNRGDIQAFVSVYTEDSVFVGSAVSKGRSQVLDRYLKRYPNRDAMGKTTFSDLDIRLLDGKHAVVVGRWKLERSQAAGGATGGIFSLVLEKVKNEWKIVLDHTS